MIGMVYNNHTESYYISFEMVGDTEKGTASLPMNNFMFIDIVSLICILKRRERKLKGKDVTGLELIYNRVQWWDGGNY